EVGDQFLGEIIDAAKNHGGVAGEMDETLVGEFQGGVIGDDDNIILAVGILCLQEFDHLI
ncbi:MAG: hypothetical protein P8Y14_28445, partial [Anaerolineales bacterium]